MCDVLLPPGVNPTAVKYIYHIISNQINTLAKHGTKDTQVLHYEI
jgi:hypothetical protein